MPTVLGIMARRKPVTAVPTELASYMVPVVDPATITLTLATQPIVVAKYVVALISYVLTLPAIFCVV